MITWLFVGVHFGMAFYDFHGLVACGHLFIPFLLLLSRTFRWCNKRYGKLTYFKILLTFFYKTVSLNWRVTRHVEKVDSTTDDPTRIFIATYYFSILMNFDGCGNNWFSKLPMPPPMTSFKHLFEEVIFFK